VRFRVRGQAQLQEDLLHVCLHGALSDEEPGGERAVRDAFCTEAQHFPLALGQLGEWILTAPTANEMRDDRRINDGLSASGCSLSRSSAAANRSSVSSSSAPVALIFDDLGLPCVRVPVLSRTTVSSDATCSSATAFLHR
jgi:hypothetical protein